MPYAVYDCIAFLCRWLMSSLFLGTVVVISNRSDEVLGITLYSTNVGPRGYADRTWQVDGARDVIPSKVPFWTISPRRRRSFMLPFSTSLIILGSENNFKYYLRNCADTKEYRGALTEEYQRHLLDKFVALWSTRHSFVPRWVEIRPTLSVNTSLRVGECICGYEYVNPAWYGLPRFEIKTNQQLYPRILLPVGSQVSVGASVWNPDQLDRNLTLGTALSRHGFGWKTINMFRDVLNEVSALVEVVNAVNVSEKIFAAYLFWMIMVWNSLKDHVSPACQYSRYGAGGYLLTGGFDCILSALLTALPGGLQAILVLLISRPDDGAQQLSAVLAFGNLSLFASMLALRIAHEIPMHWISWCKEDRSKFLAKEALGFVFVGVPIYGIVAFGYYYTLNERVKDIIRYFAAGMLTVGFHWYFVFYLFELDVAMKGITPLAVMKLVGQQVAILIKIFDRRNLDWLIERLSKYLTECLICLLVLASLAVNTYIIYRAA